MAEMISIPKKRIIERSSRCVDAALDKTDADGQMYWNLMLLPDPLNELESNTPMILASNLNDRRLEIQSFIPRIDS